MSSSSVPPLKMDAFLLRLRDNLSAVRLARTLTNANESLHGLRISQSYDEQVSKLIGTIDSMQTRSLEYKSSKYNGLVEEGKRLVDAISPMLDPGTLEEGRRQVDELVSGRPEQARWEEEEDGYRFTREGARRRAEEQRYDAEKASTDKIRAVNKAIERLEDALNANDNFWEDADIARRMRENAELARYHNEWLKLEEDAVAIANSDLSQVKLETIQGILDELQGCLARAREALQVMEDAVSDEGEHDAYAGDSADAAHYDYDYTDHHARSPTPQASSSNHFPRARRSKSSGVGGGSTLLSSLAAVSSKLLTISSALPETSTRRPKITRIQQHNQEMCRLLEGMTPHQMSQVQNNSRVTELVRVMVHETNSLSNDEDRKKKQKSCLRKIDQAAYCLLDEIKRIFEAESAASA